MVRRAGGTVFEHPAGSGRFFARFTTSVKRTTVRLHTCRSLAEAQARKDFIAAELQRLRAAGAEEHADTLFRLASQASESELERVRLGVDAIVAGEVEPVQEECSLPEGGPTFREFALQWTSGELHRRHPDYVKLKKTVDDDEYRLEAHVYPIVGDVPLRSFSVEHAEEVMRSLDGSLAAGSRRQVAQLLRRILSLAAYPARIIEASPIPVGFLPKPERSKAQAWLYPEEEARLLACTEVPLLYRILYGFLGREGMRRDEALALTWADVDLERGTITLDENKTDDPRAWVLGQDVVRALARWRRVQKGNQQLIFVDAEQRIDGDHLAAVLRRHLAKAGGARAVLFKRNESRAPIRAHDLRATFVTLALAVGKTEAWVCDRTGHRSSTMLSRYRRAARSAAELGLGWLKPMHEAIPELAEMAAPAKAAAPVRRAVERSDARLGQPCETARAKLAAALAASIGDLVASGDVAAAQVAIEALRRLLPEADVSFPQPPARGAAGGEGE